MCSDHPKQKADRSFSGPPGGGFVKLYRDAAGSLLLHDGELLRLYVWCLIRASFQPETVSVRVGRGCVNVRLQPGELVFQKSAAARDLGWNPITAWKRLKRIEALGFIQVEGKHQMSVVSILNSDTCETAYSERETPGKHQREHQTPKKGNAKLSENINNHNNFDMSGEKMETPNSEKGKHREKRKKLYKELKKNPPISPQGDDGGFGSFWQEYPRKVAKQAALKAWEKTAAIRPPLAEILSALEVQKSSAQWTREGGRFIPHPATWLNQGRWDDEIQDEPEDDCTFFRPYLRGEMQ